LLERVPKACMAGWTSILVLRKTGQSPTTATARCTQRSRSSERRRRGTDRKHRGHHERGRNYRGSCKSRNTSRRRSLASALLLSRQVISRMGSVLSTHHTLLCFTQSLSLHFAIGIGLQYGSQHRLLSHRVLQSFIRFDTLLSRPITSSNLRNRAPRLRVVNAPFYHYHPSIAFACRS